MRLTTLTVATIFLGFMASPTADATVIFYDSRSAFEAAVGASIADDYSAPAYATINGADNQMDKVFGETRYDTTGFRNANTVSPNIFGFDGPAYCAGCNGSFILDFRHTSVGTARGVFGVGFDFVNNGDPFYTAFITFGDRSSVNVPVPMEFQPTTGFFGVTSDLLIGTIALGLPDGGTTQSGFFAIDNLTIAAADPPDSIPEPSTIALLCTFIGLGAFLFGNRPREQL
jgi:hypothetical protein